MNTETCLLCGGSLIPVLDQVRDHQYGAPGTYGIHRCKHCGAEQTLPLLEPADMQRLRESAAASANAATTPREARLRAWRPPGWLYRPWLRLDGDAAFHLPRGHGRRLLQFGCRDGGDLERYQANGFAVEGWESDAKPARQARARGFTIHDGELADMQPVAPYDVIVIGDRLAQMQDPRATLRDLGRHLAPGGELWISLPNAGSLFRELFGRDWIHWHVPFHGLHVTPPVLRHLLADAGFLVRSQACITPALWLTQSSLVTLYSRPGQPTRRLRKPLLLAGWMVVLRLLFFPTLFFLNRALRGDCLIVRARRAAT